MTVTAGDQASHREDPVLGLIHLDCAHLTFAEGTFRPDDHVGIGPLPRGFFENPQTWSTPTRYTVARGAGVLGTLRGDAAAIRGLKQAVVRIASTTDLVITNCGFFWSARAKWKQRFPGTVLLSGLELLEIALGLTPQPVGVVTFSAEDCRRLLDGHPDSARIRVAGVDHLPTWTMLREDDWALRGGWTVDGFRKELVGFIEKELREGSLLGIGSLLLECTAMPQFRDDIRTVTSVPILDIAEFARAALA
jgi:hypothetical protein